MVPAIWAHLHGVVRPSTDCHHLRPQRGRGLAREAVSEVQLSPTIRGHGRDLLGYVEHPSPAVW